MILPKVNLLPLLLVLCATLTPGSPWASTIVEEKLVAPPTQGAPRSPEDAQGNAPTVILVPKGSNTPLQSHEPPADEKPSLEPALTPEKHVFVPIMPDRTPQSAPPPVTVITPTEPQQTQQESLHPQKDEKAPLSPHSFIPMMDIETPKAEKATPSKKEPIQPQEAPQKATPPQKTPPMQAKKGPAKKGDPFYVPPDAAKKNDLSFLEGCWRGTRPEYATKRIVTERFCFDKNGRGKRNIIDPAVAGECYGATEGIFDAQGRLVVTSEQGYCTKGQRWGAANMICHGEGASTPCYWQFKDAGGASQSYSIPFVKE